MIIIDNFVQDIELVRALNSEELHWPLKYMWADYDFTANNPYLDLIDLVWRKTRITDVDISDMAGFEYWSGMYSAGDRKETQAEDGKFYHLFKHFDKDEALWSRAGELKTPVVGTVYYPSPENDLCEGGELCIWYTKGTDIVPKYEKLQPKFNRLVIFDPSNLHAVRMVTKGSRKAIAINLWETKPETFL